MDYLLHVIVLLFTITIIIIIGIIIIIIIEERRVLRQNNLMDMSKNFICTTEICINLSQGKQIHYKKIMGLLQY